MSADNRSTHTDALATLGTIINAGEKRDAIHLGVEPVNAGEKMMPGDHTYLQNGFAYPCAPGSPMAMGIVDPFLTDVVKAGERFWLIVYPRQITSLRHVWEHPAFPASGETETIAPVLVDDEKLHKMHLLLGEEKAVAKEAIRTLADSLSVDYDELLERADDYVHGGGYWVEGGRFEGESIPVAFWDHYEKVMQTTVPANDRGSFLYCPC